MAAPSLAGGARLCLVGAIGDATGEIVVAQFRPGEGQTGYLTPLRQVALDYGLPMAIYHDRHTILRSPKRRTVAVRTRCHPRRPAR